MVLFLIVVLVMTSVFALVYGMASLAPARSRLISKRLGDLHTGAARNYSSVQRRQRQEKRDRLEALMETFGERVTARRADWSRVQETLLQAGYRRSGAVATYFGTRLVTLTLTGAAAGGAVGGLAGGSGAVGNVGLPKVVGERFNEGVSKGEILISVHTDDLSKRQKALAIFRAEGGEYIYQEPYAA